MRNFLRFPRSTPRKEPQPPEPTTLEGLSATLQSWLSQMQDLLTARRSASATEIAAIDDKIDQLCREAAEDVERTQGSSALSVRLQRMKRLTLEEMLEQWDEARRENP